MPPKPSPNKIKEHYATQESEDEEEFSDESDSSDLNEDTLEAELSPNIKWTQGKYRGKNWKFLDNQPGLVTSNFQLPLNSSPLDYFLYFFDYKLMETIKLETEQYYHHVEHQNSVTKPRKTHWTVTTNELYVMFALSILIAHVKK